MYSRKKMLIKDFKKCKEIRALDDTILRELLNPEKENIDIHYSLAHAKVEPGKTTISHKLMHSEVYYILKGKGLMFVDEEKKTVSENQAIYIPAGAVQKIKNIGEGELEFLCIVDPPWTPECEELV
ncbi:MAG: cupin domain-containing protein [Candidatus Altiarchaeota archaeon]